MNYFLRKTIYRKFAALALTTTAGFTNAAFADIALTYDTTDAGVMVFNVIDGKAAMVMDMGQQGSGRMIYDASVDKIFMVMDDRQQYMDMDDMMKAMGGLSDMLAGAMEGMDDATKAQLGGLLGGLNKDKSQPASQVNQTGRTSSHNNIDCDVVEITEAGSKFEMCLADHDEVGVSNADFSIIRKMFKKQQSMAKQMSQIFGQSAGMSLGAMDIDRIPIISKALSGPGGTTRLKSVSATVDSSATVIPDSYTAADMMGG